MAIVVVSTTPGLNQEQYEESVRRQHLDGGMPPGCTAHIAGPGPDGWQVVAVWESGDTAARYHREVLGPILSEMGTPPAQPPTIFPLHSLLT